MAANPERNESVTKQLKRIRAGSDHKLYGKVPKLQCSLMLAIRNKCTGLVEKLLSGGVDPNVSEELSANEDLIPLFLAIKHTDYEIIKCLLDAGANANVSVEPQDPYGSPKCAIAVAIEYVPDVDLRYKIVELLLTKRTPNDLLPLEDALRKSDSKLAVLLIENGADFNYTNNRGATPLCTAIVNNKFDVAKVLIDRGHSTDNCTDDEDPAVFVAIAADNTEMLKFLLEYDKSGSHHYDWMMEMTVDHGSYDMLRMLMEYRTVDLKSEFAQKLFVRAISHHRADIMKLLIRSGMNVDFLMDSKSTVDYACDEGIRSEMAMCLARHVILLRAQNLEVRHKIEEDIHNKMYEYHLTCWRDLDSMKDRKICDDYDTTYFDILVKRGNKLIQCLRNKKILAKLDVNVCASNVYRDEWNANCLEGVLMAKRMNAFEDALRDVFDGVLTNDVIMMISEYFNDAEFSACIE